MGYKADTPYGAQRIEEAKKAVARLMGLLDDLPEEQRSYNRLARTLAEAVGEPLNSANFSLLLRRDYLSSKLDRILVELGELEPHRKPVLVEPCPSCGEVHAVGWCVQQFGEPERPRPPTKPRNRRPRFSAAADDPEMALAQLEKYYPGMFVLRKDNGNTD